METLLPDRHELQNDVLTAIVSSKGAELCSLRTRAGVEVIWQAGPEWPRHAPVLFPIVGRLNDDMLHVDGRSYRMTQHGFARDSRFSWAERAQNQCALTLRESDTSLTMYPFAFQLDITYRLRGAQLTIEFNIGNPGERVLPVSLGAHPAFNWPLDRSQAKSAHWLEFDRNENAPIRRLTEGLLQPNSAPTPVTGKRLDLSEDLFVTDAVIFDDIASRSVRYRAKEGQIVDVTWDGFTELGVWSKPSGASFLCIEPWHGFASPFGYEGAFGDKPGLMHIAPKETRKLSLSISVT